MAPTKHSKAWADRNSPPAQEPTPLLAHPPRIIYVPLRYSSKSPMPSLDDAKPAISAQNQRNSHLLRLPEKIRAKIFTYACSTDKVIELRTSAPKTSKTTDPDEMGWEVVGGANSAPFGIMLVSRQVYRETAHLPFALHTIHSTNMFDLRICLSRMSPAQRSSIRTLLIRWHSAEHIVLEFRNTTASINNGAACLAVLNELDRIVIASTWEGMKKGKGKSKFEMAKVKGDVEKWVDGEREGVVVAFEDGGKVGVKDGGKNRAKSGGDKGSGGGTGGGSGWTSGEKVMELVGDWTGGASWGWDNSKPLGG
ncbi:hypothetical protein EK21DRAFT_106727 [Setomelanomma holmii]|uniref:Uncharacterized protein n=1 Tax=Setomelanomma holmii TaxID=210430 RepID=A0A9P4HIQ7_9PLEO|nr:hypothetical protein EK21DRAFT_106727 [Setomelanomma holmii]